MATAPEDTISLEDSGFEGRVVACSAATGTKVFLGEAEDIVGNPLDGLKLWRIGHYIKTGNTYIVSDNSDNCIFAFRGEESHQEAREDGTVPSHSTPRLSHPFAIVATGPKESPFKFRGVEISGRLAPGVETAKQTRDYLRECLSMHTTDQCAKIYVDTTRQQSATIRIDGGRLKFFNGKVYFNGVRVQ
jgi:hypothetical protein